MNRKEYEDALWKIFEQNPDIKNLQRKKQEARNARKYVLELKYSQEIDRLWQLVLDEYKYEYRSIFDIAEEMNEQDRIRIWKNLTGIALLADCFDFILADTKELLVKYDSKSSFAKYDQLNLFAKEAQAQVKDIQDSYQYNFLEYFADKSDELRENILDYVEKFIIENAQKHGTHEQTNQEAEKD